MSLSFHNSQLRRTCLGCILIVAAANAPLHAQEVSSSTLTLAEAFRLTVERNPNLLAQGYHEKAAEAAIEQAGFRPNPTLDVSLENFAGTGRLQGVQGLETTVQASQTFERGGKREKRLTLAGRERETVAKEMAAYRTEILAATAIAYAQVVSAQQQLSLAEEPLKLARETLAATEARVSAGAGSPAESARARAALATAKGDYTRAEAAVVSARALLVSKWSGDADRVGELNRRIRLPENLPDQEKLLAQIGQHPRFELQQAIIASRRAAIEVEQSRATQDFTLGGGVRFLREGSDAAFVTSFSMPMPVRHKNQGNIRAAREIAAGAEQGMHTIESELRAAFGAAWQDMKTAHSSALNLRRDALPAMEEAHRIVRQAYSEGQVPLFEVLEAQRALITIHREILEAESSYAIALVRAESLTSSTFPLTNALFSTE